ncbi:UNVERIFIED_CONTAM: hypothetical protein FKN15_038335 [Acipenser sinensis]
MAQILKLLAMQQALSPAPAPAPPPAPAPEHTLAPPMVAPGVSEQDVVMSEEEQDEISITASWDEESFLREETQEKHMTQEMVPRSELASEPEVPVSSSPTWALMERASNFLQVPWKALSEQCRSVFRPAQTSTPSLFRCSQTYWRRSNPPGTDRPQRPECQERSLTGLLGGAEVTGLAQFPPVDSTIAALVRAPPPVGGLSKDPVCPNGQCRLMEAHLKKAYTAEAQVIRLANTGGLLTAYLDDMLQSVTLPEPLASELRLVSGTLLPISSFQGQALGRSLASLVVARRQLWLSQMRVPDADKSILPRDGFGILSQKYCFGGHLRIERERFPEREDDHQLCKVASLAFAGSVQETEVSVQ